MTRKEQIKSAYKQLGGSANFYDGKTILENAATIISALVVCLTIVLYAYNTGYCRVFNIPIECMPLDLKSYIPITIQVVGVLGLILFYIAYSKVDTILRELPSFQNEPQQ